MEYEEFCKEITPSIAGICNRCRKMTVEEYKDFSDDVMCEVRKHQGEFSTRFMEGVMNAVGKSLFGIGDCAC